MPEDDPHEQPESMGDEPRRWVHPSELPNFEGSEGTQTPFGAVPRRRPTLPMMAAGVVALALLGSGVLLLSTTSKPPTPTVTAVATVADAPANVQAAASSLVVLHLSDATGSRIANGLVLSGGDLIATTAPMSPTTTITVVTGTHERMGASVVATDTRSGLAVIRPESTLADPPAVTELSPTQNAVAISLGDTTGKPIRWERTTVSSNDVPVVINNVALGAVRATTRLGATPGSVLVSNDGTLEAVATPGLGQNLYLPASLITRLAEHLAQGTAPTHFALRISAQSKGSTGIKVVSVDPTGPSAGVLFEGDVVLALEGTRVHTASELVDALYVQDATVALHLTIRRHRTDLEVVIAPVPTT